MQFKKIRYCLNFKFEAGTSRGVMKEHAVFLITVLDIDGQFLAAGEAAPLPGLSIDFNDELEGKIDSIIIKLNENPGRLISEIEALYELGQFPSLLFCLEMLLLQLQNRCGIVFNNAFSEGKAQLNINGLIWMGQPDFMLTQIKDKLDAGFSCLKMKVGAIDFESEVSIIKRIRAQYSERDLVLRLDANGAFQKDDVYRKLDLLASFRIHSIEQPVKQGQYELMSSLCSKGIIPIALDEELIGVNGVVEKEALLTTIKPQYIILKPTLVGGIKNSDEWIEIAEKQKIGWWLTSALESNVGLNVIAQYAYERAPNTLHGLGTGQLYYNNILSPLSLEGERLSFNNALEWDYSPLN